eukprot:Blabericola_migrator_1__802@NODE_119_length_13646_cov_70_025112_g107_i0_p12_GENE_NODE_119_length_13646_cov_70_025112_g107_i0NODE_119_length_13646_cov_70_025112_g107_i0_p12_ORF_typecomplete_len112_score5_07_NODE_119_length_13646_cov_70_025112_g107_i01129211627
MYLLGLTHFGKYGPLDDCLLNESRLNTVPDFFLGAGSAESGSSLSLGSDLPPTAIQTTPNSKVFETGRFDLKLLSPLNAGHEHLMIDIVLESFWPEHRHKQTCLKTFLLQV